MSENNVFLLFELNQLLLKTALTDPSVEQSQHLSVQELKRTFFFLIHVIVISIILESKTNTFNSPLTNIDFNVKL